MEYNPIYIYTYKYAAKYTQHYNNNDECDICVCCIYIYPHNIMYIGIPTQPQYCIAIPIAIISMVISYIIPSLNANPN